MTVTGVPSTNEEAWALAGAWGAARYMTPFEALMWRVEQDPRLRSTMTVVYLLDGAPDWDRFVAADAMASFDRSRPPWRASLVEGVEGDRTAYVLKLHHSLTDGQGGVQLVGLLHSRKREPSPDKPVPEPPPGERTSALGVLAEQAAGAVRSAPAGTLRRTVGGAAAAGRAVARPLDGLGGATRFARSLQRVLTPPPAAPSPLLARRSRSWRFDALDVSLPKLKAAGKAAGGSLNDAYVAALLGGFRRYHEHFDTPIDELAMAMPISLRRGDHPMGGNRFAGARFAAPAGEPDPAERIRLVHEFVLTARDEPALDVFGLLAPGLNRLPMPLVARWYAAQTTKLDLQASNVAGLPYQAYIAGARIERMLPFGPLPGCAVMATLLSYAGTCSIGLNLDPAAVTEPDVFVDCLEAGIREVLALANGRANGHPGSAGGRRLGAPS